MEAGRAPARDVLLKAALLRVRVRVRVRLGLTLTLTLILTLTLSLTLILTLILTLTLLLQAALLNSQLLVSPNNLREVRELSLANFYVNEVA